MKLYRADKRDFDVGDEVTSANEFTSKNPDGSEDIERIFEEQRPPEKPKRSGPLYLFDNEVVAKKHWSKMADGKLYEVELREETILHKGDMRFVDEAFLAEDSLSKIRCATDYWEGKESDKPRMELLVSRAFVIKIISKDQTERRKYLLNWPSA